MSELTKLTFIGDIMCKSEQITAHKLHDEVYDFNEIFSCVSDYFKNSDYVVANLETPIAGKEKEYSYSEWSFNAPIQFAEAVKNAGINLVSTANNHCLDRGIIGLINTIEGLNKCKLKHVGTNANNDCKRYLFEEIKGIKVAFLSYTYGTNAFLNEIYLKKNERFMVNMFQEQELSNWLSRRLNKSSSLYAKIYRKLKRLLIPAYFRKPLYEHKESNRLEKKHLLNDLKACREKGAEFVIMCMHAGGQYNDYPTAFSKRIVRYLAKHGVNAVIGNHEHVVHKCDASQINDGIIKTYSLGNFTGLAGVSKAPYNKMAEYSVIFNLYLEKHEDSVKINKSTFSVTKSVAYGKDKVKTALLYDLINECENDLEKNKLISDNTAIVNRFLCKELQNVVNQKEYNICEYLK